MIAFAQQIKQWRKSKGLLQKEAADILQVSYGAWRSWERGKKTPRKVASLSIEEIQRRMDDV